jgi:adenosylmethionine-8-amino-7-oxononanoate aminotransferase
MAAVELDANALEREPRLLDRVVAGAREHGVLTRSLRGCALHISPAFVVSPQQLDALVDGLRAALAAARPEEVGSGPAT